MAYFSEEHIVLRKTIRDFARNEIAPSYRQRSKTGEWPTEILKKMGSLGFFGIKLPAEFGGNPDSDFISIGLIVEEVGRADPGLALWAGSTTMFGLILDKAVSPKLREDSLTRLIKGEFAVAGAITEPESGADALAMKATAVKNGDSYTVKGEKTSISFVRPAEGTLVWLKTDPTKKGAKGVSLLYVRNDLPGVQINYFEDTGLKVISRASLSYDDVKVPADCMIAGEGKGFYLIGQGWEYIRLVDALASIGAAKASIDETIEYIKNRKAFGMPISKFQGVSFKIAEHATAIEAASLLCYQALWRLDHGLDYFKESSMCKSWALRVASEAIYDCLLFHGHYGYAEDMPFSQRMRDIIGLEIADAPPSLHKMVVSRHLIGKEWV